MTPQEALKKYFGYDSFRPQQEAVIRTVLEGKDCLVLMPTGGGKSICYQIPALVSEGTAIVVSPLISLMKDQVEALRAAGIPAGALNSGQSESENLRLRQACREGKLRLLYLSPEMLLSELYHLVADMRVSLVAIDEAHCVSQWGHDFRPEYTQLGAVRDALPGTPFLALTATADKVTRQDIVRQLRLEGCQVFVSSFDRPNLSLDVRRGLSGKEKLNALTDFIGRHPDESGIIYCLSRKNTESLADELVRKGFDAAAYHAGLGAEERDRVQTDFIRDRLQIVVATVAFGMGIDKSNVRWVVHYQLPKSIESFYQEIGRAGRDGLPADTLLFYNYADIIQLTKFAEESGQREINKERLDRMREYAEADVCRRRILLNYFGETTAHDCGNCDICQNPPQRFDGHVLAQKALSAIVRTHEQADFRTVIDILRARYTPAVKALHYDQLPTFGAGRDVSPRDWQDYLLQLLQLGLIEIAYDEHNHLKTTPLGTEVLYGRQPLQLACIRREEVAPKPAKATRKTAAQPLFPAPEGGDRQEEALFQELRKLRLQLANEQGLPPYIIMSDKVLRLLAIMRPKTVEAFGNVSGIGEYKQKKYGRLFVDAILRFLSR